MLVALASVVSRVPRCADEEVPRASELGIGADGFQPEKSSLAALLLRQGSGRVEHRGPRETEKPAAQRQPLDRS
jgi:hypothetical protein